MIKTVQTAHLSGPATVWDGTNLEEVQEVAGNDYIGAHSTYAVVRNDSSGEPVWVRNGWTVARIAGKTLVFSSDSAPILLQDVPGEGEAVA
jgi:hypothetical protein